MKTETTKALEHLLLSRFAHMDSVGTNACERCIHIM